MSDRIVLRLMCNQENEISYLFGSWGAVDQAEAIREIESGERSYILQLQDGSHALLDTVGTGSSKRLCAYANGAEVLSLEDAPQISA
ncbi:MAG TPA: hypothetical protein VHU90_06400 [Galbitalea sp.]|nr:hypothetical protein [Galbitalea sp.]